MIVTLCTVAQQYANSSSKYTYTGTTYRVSDEDFCSFFTDADVTTSRIHCLSLCTTNRTNQYYDSNTSYRCPKLCVLYNPVTSGTNSEEKYYIPGKTLSIYYNMLFLSCCAFVKM